MSSILHQTNVCWQDFISVFVRETFRLELRDVAMDTIPAKQTLSASGKCHLIGSAGQNDQLSRSPSIPAVLKSVLTMNRINSNSRFPRLKQINVSCKDLRLDVAVKYFEQKVISGGGLCVDISDVLCLRVKQSDMQSYLNI